MSQQEQQEQSPRPRKKNKSRLPIFFLVTILLVVAGAGFYLYTRSQEERSPVATGPQTAPSPTATGGDAAGGGNERPLPPEPRESATEGTTPPGADTLPEAGNPDGQCAELARKLHGFFRHLDQQGYISEFTLNGTAQDHFTALADKLLANPPVVAREADDLYTILKNTAHFFRVIGKEDTLLIKAILDRERESMEDVARDLYLWLTAEGCQEELLPFSPPLAKVYEYAGFFLNTMGGRSYLFRRDSRTRLLVTYYAILIVDRANASGLNRYGIDIRQPIPHLIQEIEASGQLVHKESYLDRLYQLQETPPQPAGAGD